MLREYFNEFCSRWFLFSLYRVNPLKMECQGRRPFPFLAGRIRTTHVHVSQLAGFKSNNIYAHSTTSILLVMLAV